MPATLLPRSVIAKIHRLYLSEHINILQASRKLHIARNTLKRYLKLFQQIGVIKPDRVTDFDFCLSNFCLAKKQNPRLIDLHSMLSYTRALTAKAVWTQYRRNFQDGYAYSQFAYHYSTWLKNKQPLPVWHISETDRQKLISWRRSADRRKWEFAVVLLDASANISLVNIARKIERSTEKLNEWLKGYQALGLDGFTKKPRKTNVAQAQHIHTKKANLMRLLHENPSLHGFNRTSWRLVDLAKAYEFNYGNKVSIAMISEYIRQEGYVFRKARKTLTSPDPDFRAKLDHIKSILSTLGEKEKFFSVDEYGPFSVKTKGGRDRIKRGETKTYPQHQKSKGFLICTAALELSTNQVTHFYSLKKDTAEMIILIGILIEKYRGQDKLYFSWDAASWHASKKLLAYLAVINSLTYRQQHGTPLVELAPLPASAQFLNVIESVFSGLAKSVIHNSDYDGVASCKAAINRYFAERNAHFLLHPKRAGNKVWGKERVVAEFQDHQNCKDPNWR